MGRFATIGATTTNDNLEQADEVRNYEISKKVTTVRKRAPRIVKLSAAVLVDGVEGQARTVEEIQKLEELAKSAVGYDDKRGDRFEIASHVFTRPEEIIAEKPLIEPWQAILLALLLASAIAFFVFFRRKKAMEELETMPVAMLQPGKRVADIDAIINEEAKWRELQKKPKKKSENALRPCLLQMPCCENVRAAWWKKIPFAPSTSFVDGSWKLLKKKSMKKKKWLSMTNPTQNINFNLTYPITHGA